jgi:hypothetical protein
MAYTPENSIYCRMTTPRDPSAGSRWHEIVFDSHARFVDEFAGEALKAARAAVPDQRAQAIQDTYRRYWKASRSFDPMGGNATYTNCLPACWGALAESLEKTRDKIIAKTAAPQQAQSVTPQAVLVIGQSYPCFLEHYAALQNEGYIAETKNGLRWEKSKQSLAEYFDAIKPQERKHNWATLENFFGVKDLKQAASQNGNSFKGKKSRDFDTLKKIITLP